MAVTGGRSADRADSDGLLDGGWGMPATGLRPGAALFTVRVHLCTQSCLLQSPSVSLILCVLDHGE